MQPLVHALRQRPPDAGHGLQIVQARVLDALSATEMAEQRLHFFCTKPLH